MTATCSAALAEVGITEAAQLGQLPGKIALRLAGYLVECGQKEAAEDVLLAVVDRLHLLEEVDQCARILLDLGNFARPIALLEERLRRSFNVSACQKLVQAYLAAGRIEEAQELAISTISSTNGQRIIAWDMLTEVCLASGNVAGANDACAHMQELDPRSQTTRLRLAAVQLASGEQEWARWTIQELQQGPNGEQPGTWLARQLLPLCRQASLDEVEARLREIIEQRTSSDLENLRSAVNAALKNPPKTRLGGGTLVRSSQATHKAPFRKGRGEQDTASAEGNTLPDEELHEESQSAFEEEAPPELLGALQRIFGYTSFRSGQVQVISAVLAGKDILALMPTGAGKSLCYLLPAMLREGTTLLISPLIALMKDQIDNLPPYVRERTTVINSDIEGGEQRKRLEEIGNGQYKLIYVAPERLRQMPFLHVLRRANISLVVIDEAHCISLWGHDFRPDYLFITKALTLLDHPALLAVTATATPPRQREIGQALGRELQVISTGITRPNLRYEVWEVANDEQRLQALQALLKELPGSGIIYARSKKKCEEVARFLGQHSYSVAYYHAGLEKNERQEVHEAFMAGYKRIIVATIAFGMGIDKANVRFVIHYNLPSSLEAYSQESGRAGRDGKPARCILFYSDSDRSQLSRFLREDQLSLEFLREIYRQVKFQANQQGRKRYLQVWFDAFLSTMTGALNRSVFETELRVGISALEKVKLFVQHPDLPRTPLLILKEQNLIQPSLLEERDLAGGTILPVEAQSNSRAVNSSVLQGVVRALELRSNKPVSFDLLLLSESLGKTPSELESLLLLWHDAGVLTYRYSGRAILLELLPAPDDAGKQLQDLLSTRMEEMEANIADLVAYATMRQCRHYQIARYFGTKAEPRCQACDYCLPGQQVKGIILKARPRSSPATPGDGLNVEHEIIGCIATLRWPLGKKGLVRTLTGHIATSPWAQRSPYFGRLREHSPTRLERTIQQMIERGILVVDETGEYRLLSLTGQGQRIADTINR